jgi:uncharacterized SAM-binding protein YcdF (DUF218 family)
MTYTEPLLAFFLLVAAAGLVRLRNASTRLPRLLIAAGLLGILLASSPLIPWAAGFMLENGYEKRLPAGLDGAQAIVVLSGTVLPAEPWRPVPLLGWETFDRVSYAALLFRRHPAPIVVSGGALEGDEAFAVSMRRVLIEQSIPPEQIWTEDKSTSTFENASFITQLLRARGIGKIMLVTHAYHMPRAERCFRKQGIEVIPAPCTFTTPPTELADLWPGWRGLRASERILHEYIGLAWYFVRGYV